MSAPAARTPRICLLAIAIASCNLAVSVEQPLATRPNALPVAVPPDTFPVTMTVTLQLSNLHPAATQGGLLCGAKVILEADANSLRDHIKAAARQTDSYMYNNYFSQQLLSPAHYYHADAHVTFPITNRGYSGTQTVTMYVPNSTLINPQTHAVWLPPTVVVGCWLTINGVPRSPLHPGRACVGEQHQPCHDLDHNGRADGDGIDAVVRAVRRMSSAPCGRASRKAP